MRPSERRPREPLRARRREGDPEGREERAERGGAGTATRSRRRAGTGAAGPRPAAGEIIGVAVAVGASVAVLAAVVGVVTAVVGLVASVVPFEPFEPAAGAAPPRSGAVALPNWTPVAAAAFAFAACWLTAVGAAHGLAKALARR